MREGERAKEERTCISLGSSYKVLSNAFYRLMEVGSIYSS